MTDLKVSTAPSASPTWLRVFAGLGAALLILRATTTLIGGASWSGPGDGWRSLWQFGMAGILVLGLIRPAALRLCIATVGLVYVGCSLVEIATPDALFGWIPVDMRDRIVHPTIALVALGAVALSIVVNGGSRTIRNRTS